MKNTLREAGLALPFLSALMCSLTSVASAQPNVPDGYIVTQIAPLIDGQIPELSAIDDPSFGTGVITGTVDNGVATFRLLTANGQLQTLAVWNEAPPDSNVLRVRLDSDAVVDGSLHAAVVTGDRTCYLTVDSQGHLSERWEQSNQVRFDFAFTRGVAGNPVGSVLLDMQVDGGTELAWMDPGFAVTTVNGDSLPPARDDTDVRGFQWDSTGFYGGGVLLADSDPNHDDVTAIYELRDVLGGGLYRLITDEVPTSTRFYGDLAIADVGDFGGVIYVTEQITDEIQLVTPDGTHMSWATGFAGIDSLSIAPDGDFMYVGDQSGVWLIRAIGNEPGPAILCSEPSVPGGSRLTGAALDSLRIIFSEAVSFDDGDITIGNANGDPVAFDATGSGTQFMLIALGEELYADEYTVIIADAVTSVATGQPLDGDNNGVAGGAAILTFEHQCTADLNGNGEIDLSDLGELLSVYGTSCK
jgi:hypothetical protein